MTAVSSQTSASTLTYLKEVLLSFKVKPHGLTLGVALLFALFVEIFIFNATYFYSLSYPEAKTSFKAEPNKLGVHITNTSNVFTIDTHATEVKSLKIAVTNIRLNLNGKIIIDLDPDGKNKVTAHTFSIASPLYQNEINEADILSSSKSMYFDLSSFGKIYSIAVSFDQNPNATYNFLDELTINATAPFNFSFIRVAFLLILSLGIYAIFKTKAYQQKVLVNSVVYKVFNRSALIIALLFLTLCLFLNRPSATNGSKFNFLGGSQISYTSTSGNWFYKMPKTAKEILDSDAYVQQLDAFLKGQLNIDYPTDPKIYSLKNPYDLSERLSKNIIHPWDRAFYDGKFYVYFGIAPLFLVYLPSYLLLGEIPIPALSLYILSLMAVFSVYFASNRITEVMVKSVNPVILLCAKLALLFSLALGALIGTSIFYSAPYISAIAMSALALGCALHLMKLRHTITSSIKDTATNNEPSETNITKDHKHLSEHLSEHFSKHSSDHSSDLSSLKGSATSSTFKPTMITYFEMVICGIAIVLTVASRPLMIVYASIMVGAILLWYLVHEKCLKSKLLVLIAVGTPVVIGALALMWFNYVRFHSITEFGQFLQFTIFDTRYNETPRDLGFYQIAIYDYLFSPINFIGSSPFVSLDDLHYQNTGVFLNFVNSIGILNYPISWAVLLMVPYLIYVYRCKKALHNFKIDPTLTLTQKDVFRFDSPFLYGPLNNIHGKDFLSRENYLVVAALITFIVSIPLAALSYANAGVSIRYNQDINGFLLILFFMMSISVPVWIRSKDSEETRLIKGIVYALMLVGFLYSVLVGFLLSFEGANSVLNTINPRAYEALRILMMPLANSLYY